MILESVGGPENKTEKSAPRRCELLDRCTFLIPVYNHGRRLAGVIRRALSLEIPVIVVDDGSTDDSLEVARRFEGVTVLQHERNLGKGAALLTGLRAAARCADYAITLDADGQHDPDDALQLVEAIRADNDAEVPIVIGRRTGMERHHVPWTSRFGRLFSNFWVRLAGGPRLEDSQSGYRVYPIAKTLSFKTRGRRYQFEVEILPVASWHRTPIIEVPVRVSYPPEGERVSHFRPFVDFWRNALAFTRLIVMRLFLPRRTRCRLSTRTDPKQLVAPT